MATVKHNYRRTQLITLVVLSAILFLNSGCGKRSAGSRLNSFDYLLGGQLPDSSSQNSWRTRSRVSDDDLDSPSASDNDWTNGPQAGASGLSPSTIQTAVNFGDLNTCYYNVLDQGIKNLRNTQYAVQDVYIGAGTELMKCYEYIITVKQQTYNNAIKRAKDYQVWQSQWAAILQNWTKQQQARIGQTPLPRPPSVLLKPQKKKGNK